MKNTPILGLLLGIVVILVIVIFSLGYQLSKAHNLSSKEAALRMRAEEEIDKLEKQNSALKEKIESLSGELEEGKEALSSKDALIKDLELELEKLKRLKEKLEENLKEELMRQKS